MQFKTSILAIAMFASFNLFAQSDRPFKITEISVYTGSVNNRGINHSYSDFQKLAPQSTLLKNDFSTFSSGYGITNYGQNVFGINLGINRLSEDKESYNSGPQFRAGFFYSRGTLYSSNYSKSESRRADTLTSTSGAKYYIDTIISESYNMDYTTEQLRLDVNMIFRSNQNLRWSLFAGFGINAGVIFSSQTNIGYSKVRMVPFSNNYNFDWEGKSEHFEGNGGFSMSMYVPLGIDWRVGKNNEFWKRIHLFYEARPSLQFLSIKGVTTPLASCTAHLFGLRVIALK